MTEVEVVEVVELLRRGPGVCLKIEGAFRKEVNRKYESMALDFTADV